jgi:HPt (histidine-containing phosphotransfer) domain-containing protein
MSSESIFNLDDALARVDDDRELFQTMAEIFIEQVPKDLADTQAALDAQDAAALARCAHRLKGALLQFCASSAFEAARELEEIGQRGHLARAVAVCATLETELVRLLAALRELLEKGLPS